jgi:uracil-DNA glycosylase
MTKLAIIGEAYGEQEAFAGEAFVGPAGQELSRMLAQAGYGNDLLPYAFTSSVRMINYWAKFPYPRLNVFNERPHDNNVELFYAKPSDKVPVDKSYPSRRFGTSIHWVKEEYTHHLESLHATLEALHPNVIVALGNTALWALGLPPTISKLRGNILTCKWGKVVATYHPASVLRKWDQRVLAVLDLAKALRESESAMPTRLDREIWTEPTIDDLYKWWFDHGSKATMLAVDIETVKQKQISEIGFAANSTHALHVPFVYQEGGVWKSWWATAQEELEAFEFVRMVCESEVPKIGQNLCQYDSFWLAKEWGVVLHNVVADTMTLSHCWSPELPKNLGFLASLFCSESEWKSIRSHSDKHIKED